MSLLILFSDSGINFWSGDSQWSTDMTVTFIQQMRIFGNAFAGVAGFSTTPALLPASLI